MSEEETQGSQDTQEVLVVVSKLKKYIKAKSGMNTSDSVASVLTELLHIVCDQAIENAKTGGRKTVMDRDVKQISDRIAAGGNSASLG